MDTRRGHQIASECQHVDRVTNCDGVLHYEVCIACELELHIESCPEAGTWVSDSGEDYLAEPE